MQLVAKSDLSTGNKSYASYALKSNDLMFVFSAPYGGGSSEEAGYGSDRPLITRRPTITVILCMSRRRHLHSDADVCFIPRLPPNGL